MLLKLRKMDLFQFVVNNKTNCYRAFKLGINHKDYKTTEGRKLILLARKALKYSHTTWSGDIYWQLWKQYKSIVIDGVMDIES
jgi:hypothetical protein